MKKHLISVTDFSGDEMQDVFLSTLQIKTKLKKGVAFKPLADKILAMIFQKPSTRTRVSFEAGMLQLGGHALFLSSQELQLKRGETIADTARTLSRYVDGIMIRAISHADVAELAKYSTIPVINGLSDLEHPCQVLGDIYTIIEKKVITKFKKIPEKINLDELKRIKVAYFGDSNNVSNSLMLACGMLGMELVVCSPKEYSPSKEIILQAGKYAFAAGAEIKAGSNPSEAAKDADVIYTDVWASMGKEAEQEKRAAALKPYQVNKALVAKAKPDVIVMHCLPARRGEEITDEVMDGPNSVVFDQSENRLHTQKAILVHLMK
jgi:ornithine carbamoyltransferase